MRITRLAAVSGAAVIAVTLAACSSGESTPAASGGEPSGTVTGIFDTQYKAGLEPIVADFEKKYPDVKVNISYQGGDLGTLITQQIQGGTAPDILLTFPGGTTGGAASDNVIPLADKGLIEPIEPDWRSDIPDLWKSSVEYKGKLYAFPGAVQPLTAMYNQTYLDELGLKVPTTIDEVYQFCKDATSKGVYAYAQGLGDVSAGPQMLTFAQVSSLIYGPDPDFDGKIASGDATYAGSGWEESFEISKKMFDAGCFGKGALGRDRTQGQTAVAKRQALGLVDVGAVLASIKAQDPKDAFVVADTPTGADTSYITSLPIYTLTVNAKAKNLTAAKAFVEFAGEPEESAKYAEGFSSVPLIPNDAFTPSAELETFTQLVNDDKTAALPQIQQQVQVALNTQLQAMYLGKLTPKQVAQKLDQAFEK